MLRHVLPIAVAAAAIVATPTYAFATAPQAPVENLFSAGYYGSTEVDLSDGRHVSASLNEHRGASQNGWTAALSLFVTEQTCPGDSPCQTSFGSGDVTLSDTQVAFTRSLDSASAHDIPMTLWIAGPGYMDPPTEEHVTVSLVFTGVGAVTRDSYKGDLCGDGERVCQSHRVGADRDATVDVTIDGQHGSGPGHLSYVLGTDTAAPKFVYGG